MPKKKAAVRRDWTNADVRTLKALAKQRAGVAKIAKKLKRTPGANAVGVLYYVVLSEIPKAHAFAAAPVLPWLRGMMSAVVR